MKLMLLTLCYVSFFIIGCNCSQEQPTLPDTSPETFPFHALIKGTHTCNGILISKDYVITPASCVHGASKISIFLGFSGYPYFLSNHAEPNRQIYYSEKFIIHDDFAKIKEDRYLNNIALVQLPSPAILSKTVQPGKLITKEESQLLEGKIVNITGWILSFNSNLKVAGVQLRNQDTCNFLFGDRFFRNQEICVKWLTIVHLNLLGNPVSVNGKIVGFQTNTPVCAVQSSSCTRNDMVLNFVPFLDWISRQTHVHTSQFTEPKKDDSHIAETVKILHNAIKEVKEKQQNDIANLNNKLDIATNNFQIKQKEDADYAVKLNEEIGDMRSEISNSQARQNASIIQLREDIGEARTEITNGLTAQKTQNDNFAKRTILLDTKSSEKDGRLLEIENILKLIKNQTELNEFYINELVAKFQKEIDVLQIRISHFEQEKWWKKEVQGMYDKLTNSLKNVSAVVDHCVNTVDDKVDNLQKALEHRIFIENKNYENLNQAFFNVSVKNKAELLGISGRIHLIEQLGIENKALLNKQILIENEHIALILKDLKFIEDRYNCCEIPAE